MKSNLTTSTTYLPFNSKSSYETLACLSMLELAQAPGAEGGVQPCFTLLHEELP